jgi:hypothetical protein
MVERRQRFIGKGLALGAGVRTAMVRVCTHLHKNITARRPAHRSSRHDVAHGAWHSGTSRGSTWLVDSQEDSFPNAWKSSARRHGVAAVRGHNKGGTVRRLFRGKQRHTALGGSKARSQGSENKVVGMRSRGQRRSHWGDSVGVACLVKTDRRRRSWRRSASCSAHRGRPPHVATAPAPFNHGRPLVLAHQRRCGARLLLPSLSLPPLPLCRCFRPANLPRGYPR